MQVVRNIVILLIILPFLMMFFMPKKELYYMLEKKLESKNIVISGEALREGTFGLTVEHPTFYFSGAPLARAKQIELWSILLYTRADIEGLMVAEGLPAEMSLENIQAVHSVLSVVDIQIKGESSIGALGGQVQLKDRMVHIRISGDEDKKSFARYLKKDEKGWYYESKF